MSLIKTLKRTIGVVSLVGILGGTAELILSSIHERANEEQTSKRIEKNMAENPRVPLDTPEEYIEPVKEAIRSGRVQPGAIVKALNKEGTRIREFRYDGREGGYGFTFLREYDFDANDANNNLSQ